MTVNTTAGPVTFETRPLWSEWFAAFDTGAFLLDLATGSGQVAGYAVATAEAEGKVFEVTGVDYAQVRPLAGCTLLGDVALEKLPFPASHFDGASSQFGIEYADSRLALTEIARVLKPGGRALFLVHHAASAITRQTAEQIAAYDKVIANGVAVRQARRAFSAHQRGLPPASVQAAEQAFADAVRRAKERLEPFAAYEPVRYLVSYLSDLADRVASYEPVSALARIDAFEAGNSAWRHRQLCQTRAALDGVGINGFVERADRCGLALDDRCEITDLRGDLIAWRLSFRKL